MRARTRSAAGFTLLEVLIAVAIFSFVAIAAEQTMANAHYMSASGRRARDLRMLAERKLGEILTFEKHYDDNFDGTFDDYDEYADRFRDWTWKVEIRDVTVFGISTSEDAQYLFGEPTDEEKLAAKPAGTGATGGTGQSGTPTKKGEKQELREITLRVAAPSDEGTSDSVEIVTFAPLLDKKTTAAPK